MTTTCNTKSPRYSLRPSNKIESVQPGHEDYSLPRTRSVLDDYVSRSELAKQLGHRSTRTLEMWAHRGIGPRVTILSKRAMYAYDDIAAWVEAQLAKSEARFAPRGGV